MNLQTLNTKWLRNQVTNSDIELTKFQLGRRGAIKAMGATAILSAPFVSFAGNGVHRQRWNYQLRDNAIDFYIGSQLLWTLDGNRFGKSCRLILKDEPHALHFHLDDARLPGSNHSFRFEGSLAHDLNAFSDFHLEDLGVRMNLNFVDWLLGTSSAIGKTRSEWTIPIESNSRIEILKDSQISLNRSSQIIISSNGCGILKFHKKELKLDRIEISLAPESDKTKYKEGFSLASIIELSSNFGAQELLNQYQNHDNQFSWSENLINRDSFSIAFGKLMNNKEASIFTAKSSNPMKFEVHGKKRSHEIALSSTILALETVDSKSKYSIIGSSMHNTAQLTDGLQHYYLKGEKPSFLEISGTKNTVHICTYKSALLEERLEVYGGISLPIKQDKSERIEVNFLSKPKSKTKTDSSQLNVNNITGEIIRLNARNSVSFNILRPDDFLLLSFQYYNCQYRSDGGPKIVKRNENQPAYLVVRFQSQHTIEQAFPEQGSRRNRLNSLPVNFNRAGASRLVYKLPGDFNEIPANIYQMLNWSKYELQVNYRARTSFPLIHSAFVSPKAKMNWTNNNSNFNANIPQTAQLENNQNTVLIAGMNSNQPKYSVQQEVKMHQMELLQQTLPQNITSSLVLEPRSDAPKKAFLKIREPNEFDTSLEIPARLFISPNQFSHFTHSIAPKRNLSQINSGKTIIELWHTRLGVGLASGNVTENSLHYFKTISAIWSRDYGRARRGHPFNASLEAFHRHYLVEQTSNHRINNYRPKPVLAKKLMLSSLGAWTDFQVNFDLPKNTRNTPLASWKHRATMGRDQYVEIAEVGYLYPFGHKAALITITERKLEEQFMAAANFQKQYIVVLEPEKTYPEIGPENEFIEFPFQKLTIKENGYFEIDPVENILEIDSRINEKDKDTINNFWVTQNNQQHLFTFESLDKDGLIQEMRMPLIFIAEKIATTREYIEQLNNRYSSESIRRRFNFRGQLIGYAESLLPDDTVFPTNEMEFLARAINTVGDKLPCFTPIMERARVHIKSIQELLDIPIPVDIRMFDSRNPSEIFAELVQALPLDFSGLTDRLGGLTSPNAALSALSRVHGVVAGKIEEISRLDFDPKTFFLDNIDWGAVAKLFGAIPLSELIQSGIEIREAIENYLQKIRTIIAEVKRIKAQITAFRSELEIERQRIEAYIRGELEARLREEIQGRVDEARRRIESELEALKEELISEIRARIDQQIELLREQLALQFERLKSELEDYNPRIPGLKVYKTDDAVIIEYRWEPEINERLELGILEFNTTKPKDSLKVFTKIERPLNSNLPTNTEVSSSISDFSVELRQIIRVKFKEIQFAKDPGEKSSVKVQMDERDPITFLGPLSFINGLQRIIPGNGFANGPQIDLLPTLIRSGFNFSIPSAEVGILSIANIALNARMNLPFTGAPLSFAFGFSRRENPFILTISGFGGGGFFGIENTARGLIMLEAAFEFGASLSLNLGVASGGASVMGGFYFKMDIDNTGSTSCQLTGYLRINGHLSILGLINMSMEFYLALTYTIRSGKSNELYGEATIRVKVSVLFFKKTVSVTARRTLKGADADPTFKEMIEEQDWLNYCKAFA